MRNISQLNCWFDCPHLERDPLPALALTLDSSSMTACGQAYGLEVYFERLTRAFGKPGDVSIGGMSIHRPGTLIGKALEPLEGGLGEILVLLMFQ